MSCCDDEEDGGGGGGVTVEKLLDRHKKTPRGFLTSCGFFYCAAEGSKRSSDCFTFHLVVVKTAGVQKTSG